MTDCRECRHSKLAYAKLICVAENMPKPVEYMRDDRSQCGLEAMLFEPKEKRRYSEFEDE